MLVAALILMWLAVIGVLVGWYLDNRRHAAEVLDILDRISTSPRIEVRESRPVPTIAAEPVYVSDLPYHDEMWDEFAEANAAWPDPEEAHE